MSNNLFLKLQSFETTLKEMTNRVTSLANSVERLQSEGERDKNATSQKLSHAERDINILKQGVSELSMLMDAGIELQVPAQTPIAKVVKPEVTEAPELEIQTEYEPKLQLQYGQDGEILALTRSGVDVKGMAEARGYVCIGTVSRGMDLYLKLKLA